MILAITPDVAPRPISAACACPPADNRAGRFPRPDCESSPCVQLSPIITHEFNLTSATLRREDVEVAAVGSFAGSVGVNPSLTTLQPILVDLDSRFVRRVFRGARGPDRHAGQRTGRADRPRRLGPVCAKGVFGGPTRCTRGGGVTRALHLAQRSSIRRHSP